MRYRIDWNALAYSGRWRTAVFGHHYATDDKESALALAGVLVAQSPASGTGAPLWHVRIRDTHECGAIVYDSDQLSLLRRLKAMAWLTIEIDMDNAAFEDSPTGEVRRILTKFAQDWCAARRLPDASGLKLMDVNGNTTGWAYLTEDE